MRTRLAHVGQPFLTADHNSAFQVVFEEKPSRMLPASPYTLPACFQPLPACSQLASSISLHASSILPARFQHAPSLPPASSSTVPASFQHSPNMLPACIQHASNMLPACLQRLIFISREAKIKFPKFASGVPLWCCCWAVNLKYIQNSSITWRKKLSLFVHVLKVLFLFEKF